MCDDFEHKSVMWHKCPKCGIYGLGECSICGLDLREYGLDISKEDYEIKDIHQLKDKLPKGWLVMFNPKIFLYRHTWYWCPKKPVRHLGNWNNYVIAHTLRKDFPNLKNIDDWKHSVLECGTDKPLSNWKPLDPLKIIKLKRVFHQKEMLSRKKAKEIIEEDLNPKKMWIVEGHTFTVWANQTTLNNLTYLVKASTEEMAKNKVLKYEPEIKGLSIKDVDDYSNVTLIGISH